jgi:hypothetical protein
MNTIFKLLKDKSRELRTEEIKGRKARLSKLRAWTHANRGAIEEAIHADLKRHPLETDGVEVFSVLAELKHALENLERWTAPKKVDAPFAHSLALELSISIVCRTVGFRTGGGKYRDVEALRTYSDGIALA